MGERIGRKKRLIISRADEVRALAFLFALIVIPAGGTVALIAITSKLDLSDLDPTGNRSPGYSLLSWARLLQDHPGGRDRAQAPSDGEMIEALGYMTYGDRIPEEGDGVKEFILLPDAGNPLHPAHRFGDQMIDVCLRDDARLRFSSRALVWVWGELRVVAGAPDGSEALYRIEGARARFADRAEIRKYFR